MHVAARVTRAPAVRSERARRMRICLYASRALPCTATSAVMPAHRPLCRCVWL
jgi:hypothetical protein